MAIRIVDEFPGKTAGVVEGYPHGKARDVSAPNDGTGTPLAASLVNDDQGFKQALLTAAGITPNGTPDEVGASQYLEAILKIIDAGLGIRPVAFVRFGYVSGQIKIFASKGVTGVERLSLGKYRVRFSAALPNLEYAATGNAQQLTDTNSFAGVLVPMVYTTAYVDVWTGDNSTDALYDTINANVSIVA